MPSIIQKVRTLFSANLHGMIDRALETNSLKVMDEYIRQVERNLDALEDSAATVGGSVRTLKRKYEEFSNQTDKLDRDIDTLILRGKNDLAAAAQAEMNTKQELAQEYYEQWQSQQEQYQGMLNMRMKLEGRLTTIKQEREKMRSLLELAETKKVMTKTLRSMDKLDTSGDQEIDSLLDSIYSQIDQEDARADLASRKLSDQIEDTVGIGQVELQLEERRQRLLSTE
ncbi:MAG: PspA/IM30 family protein [Chloroflexi bacterium]|nr:PspA/IM30 family protein [Chloroflexota bacterium]MCY4247658.1 PspA/IM30 family protein [Chloroflexota bacterium]